MGSQPRGVFINCPYDDSYLSCHRAILLAVVACGLEPRSALETGSSSMPRIQRIGTALQESSLSIHDLSRVHADPTSGLSRFNMPFEFGMAFFMSENKAKLGVEHDWLVLFSEEHPHGGQYISDLDGYDPRTHDGTPQGILRPVLSWLSSKLQEPLPPIIDPPALAELLSEYNRLLEGEAETWGKHVPWKRIIDITRDLVASRF